MHQHICPTHGLWAPPLLTSLEGHKVAHVYIQASPRDVPAAALERAGTGAGALAGSSEPSWEHRWDGSQCHDSGAEDRDSGSQGLGAKQAACRPGHTASAHLPRSPRTQTEDGGPPELTMPRHPRTKLLPAIRGQAVAPAPAPCPLKACLLFPLQTCSSNFSSRSS